MPVKVLTTPYPLIDADPHASRVIRYFRATDYAWWATGTAAIPGALFLWEVSDRSGATKAGMRTMLRVGGVAGFLGGFLFAYQRSSLRFLGWTENKQEEERDLKELTQRAKEGKPLYGESPQPLWVQGAAHRNSVFSQFKFAAFPMFNLVNHQHHGTDPAKYGVRTEGGSESSETADS